MRKCWKWILAVIAVLLAGLLIWFLIDYFSVPRLPPWEKERVLDELNIIGSWRPHIWYEENGYVEETGVMRYIGTYGDCYAFLVIGNGHGATMHIMPGPFELRGLSRQVFYPIDADVMLYHTKRTFPRGDKMLRACYLEYLSPEKRQEWLTDEQLEQLTQDIEKLAKAHD